MTELQDKFTNQVEMYNKLMVEKGYPDQMVDSDEEEETGEEMTEEQFKEL